MKALIGHSGFVGSTLLRQTQFDSLYRSSDIAAIAGKAFDLVVCAGVPAKKWIAEQNPAADLVNIERLAQHLAQLEARRFVLVSTVDVFADSFGASEDTVPVEAGLGAYGRNRFWLERFVRDRFPAALIVRLPGLVGPGLRKNAIFDLHNDNALHSLDARGSYQFYPMVNFWADLCRALEAGLDLVHFAAEPVTIAEVAREAFARDFPNTREAAPAQYDLHSRHAAIFGGAGSYLYDRRASLLAIRAYAQSEPHTAAAV